MFYGVYYYTPFSDFSDVKLFGFYDTLDKAKEIIAQIMPDYKPNYNNSVGGNGKIGWVNAYEMNQPLNNQDKLACWQPHTSVNLFSS